MRVLLLVLCGAVALVPALTANNVVLSVLTFTFILGILAVSFNLIYGITGQLTLFHAAAFGVGAYATHLSMAHWSISFWLGTAFALGCVAVVSLLLGIVCFRFRLKEFYFAVVTLAFAEMIRLGVMNWHSLTNGSLGINFSLKPSVWLPGAGALVIEGPVRWYYFSLACVVVVVLAYQLVVNSWIGNAFKAIRLNEDVAASSVSTPSATSFCRSFWAAWGPRSPAVCTRTTWVSSTRTCSTLTSRWPSCRWR